MLLIEAKTTGKKQITLKSSDLEKITTEALLDGRTPVLAFAVNNENYVVLLENDFLTMIDALREFESEQPVPEPEPE